MFSKKGMVHTSITDYCADSFINQWICGSVKLEYANFLSQVLKTHAYVIKIDMIAHKVKKNKLHLLYLCTKMVSGRVFTATQ